MHPESLPEVMPALIIGGMILMGLFTAWRSWKRQRVMSWCALATSALIAEFASGTPDTAVTNKILLVAAVAVGLQIIYDAHKQQKADASTNMPTSE